LGERVGGEGADGCPDKYETLNKSIPNDEKQEGKRE
jgi:hypothetical protein